MPVVIYVGQFKLYFWSRESERIHIHVKHKSLGIETIIWMDDYTVKNSSGSKRIDSTAKLLAKHYEEEIREAWGNHFGKKGH
jgi:hypothetical protein